MSQINIIEKVLFSSYLSNQQQLRKINIIKKVLFSSYLSNWQQILIVDGCKSAIKPVKAGFPQGSRLAQGAFSQTEPN